MNGSKNIIILKYRQEYKIQKEAEMKKVIVVFLSVLLLIGARFHNLTAEKKIPYTVSAVLPENQIDEKKNYFDLLVETGKEQELVLVFQNHADREIEVSIVPQNATTSSTGNINYTGVGCILENSVAYTFTDVCSPKQIIQIGANEKRDIRFLLTVPEEKFIGTLLGGFQIYETFSDDLGNNEAEKKSGAIEIQNRFEFVIGVMLRETTDEVAPDFKLGKIEPSVWNARFAIAAEIELPAATIVKDFTFSGKIVSKKSEDVIFYIEQNCFSMAPNSIYRFLENIHPDDLPVGAYTMHLDIEGNGQKWILEKDFAISSEQKKHAIEKTLDGNSKKQVDVLRKVNGFLLVFLIAYSANRIAKKRRKKNEKTHRA